MNYDDYNDFDELNNYRHSESRYLTYEEVEKVAASKVRGSILWMVLGLLISGLTGYFTLIGNRTLKWNSSFSYSADCIYTGVCSCNSIYCFNL